MEPSTPPDIRLQPRPPGSSVPLTTLQRYQWNRYTKTGTSLSDFRMRAVSLRLTGPLNVSALKDSMESVIDRHESLRTKIAIVDGKPLQKINTKLHNYFELNDLTNIPSIRQEREAVILGQEFLERKIDILIGPLFEATLLKLSDYDHIMIIGLDHLVSDATSYKILNRELLSMYLHFVHDPSFSLSPLPVQFPDYAIWEQSTYQSWINEHENYWRQRLSGAPHIRLTPDTGLSATEHPVFTRLHFPFGKSLSTNLNEIAQREHTRLPFVVLTAYIIVMSRWCDQRDLVLAFMSHGRRGHPDLMNMIGIFAHHLFLRIEIADNDSCLDVLKKVDLEFDSAQKHQDFGRVPELIPDFTELRFNWLPAREYVDHQSDNAQLLKVRSFPLKVMEQTSKNIFQLFSDSASGINATVIYRADLFAKATILRFGKNLRLVSEQLAQNPQTLISSIALAT